MVFTGVVTRVNPDANHLQIFFAPMNASARTWNADQTANPSSGPLRLARAGRHAGVSVNNFPAGTIFSVGAPAAQRRAGRRARGPVRARPSHQPRASTDAVEGSTKHGERAGSAKP
jgi:hypothetical protein